MKQQASQLIAFVYRRVAFALEHKLDPLAAPARPSEAAIGRHDADVAVDAGAGEDVQAKRAEELMERAFAAQLVRPLCAALLPYSMEKQALLRTNAELALVVLLLVRWPLHALHLTVSYSSSPTATYVVVHIILRYPSDI